MMYMDQPRRISKTDLRAPVCFRGRLAAHLFADTEEELLSYAVGVLGAKPEWVQRREGRGGTHFDLTGRMLKRAMQDEGVRKLMMSEYEDLEVLWRLLGHTTGAPWK